jgi:hypothetical protein
MESQDPKFQYHVLIEWFGGNEGEFSRSEATISDEIPLLGRTIANCLLGVVPGCSLAVLDYAKAELRELLAASRKKPDTTKKPKAKPEAYHPLFEEWWDAYPPQRRSGKRAAFAAWKNAGARVREINNWNAGVAAKHLLDKVREFAESPKGRGEYCPQPATWLNQDRFDDDPAAWADGKAPVGGPVESEE